MRENSIKFHVTRNNKKRQQKITFWICLNWPEKSKRDFRNQKCYYGYSFISVSSFVVCRFPNHFLLTRSRESWLWTNKCYMTCFYFFFFVFAFFWCGSSFSGEISFVLQQFCVCSKQASERAKDEASKQTNQLTKCFWTECVQILETVMHNNKESSRNRT